MLPSLSSQVAEPLPTFGIYLFRVFFSLHALPSVTEVTKKLLENNAFGLCLHLGEIHCRNSLLVAR
jgi:hypothetical protein